MTLIGNGDCGASVEFPTAAANDLHFRYPRTQADVLKGISFGLPAGGGLGLMGVNGAGKTTLVKILCGVLRPTVGHVEVLGSTDLIANPALKSRLGVMHQKMTFDMMLPAIDNLKIAASLHGQSWRSVKSRAIELCHEFGIADRSLRQVTFTLSGGEMRRLQLVRAVLFKPDFLVVDEPTTGLDVVGRNALWSHLLDLRKAGVALLVCSHHSDEIEKLCNELIVLHDGCVAARGSVSDIVQATGAASLDEAFVSLVGSQGSEV